MHVYKHRTTVRQTTNINDAVNEDADADLSKTFVEFSKDADFIKHLALIAVLIVVGNALSEVAW